MLEEEVIEKEEIKKQMTNKDILRSCSKYTMSLKLKTMKSDQEFVMDKYTLNIVTDKDRNLFYQDDMLCERQPRGTDQDDGLSKVENLLQTDSPKDTTEVPILEEIEKTGTGYSNSGMDYDNVHRSMNHEELNIKGDFFHFDEIFFKYLIFSAKSHIGHFGAKIRIFQFLHS